MKPHRYSLIILLLTILCATPTIARASTDHAEHSSVYKLQFDDLPRLISEKNSRVKAVQLEADAEKKREGNLTRSFLPRIELSAGSETFRQGSRPTLTQPSYGAEVAVSLFNGFKDEIENDRRKVVTLGKQANAKIAQADELQKARSAFWRIIHTKKKVALLNEAIKTNEANQKAADRRIRSGVATDSDRLEFEMRSVNLARDLGAAEIEIGSYQRDLAVYIGESLETKLEPQATLDHQHSWQAELQHSESEHEFQIQNLIHQRGEVELISKLEARRPLPQLEAFAGYFQYNERSSDRTSEDERHESVVGLRLKFHLGDYWESNRQSQAASISASALQNQIDHRRLEVESHIVTEMRELSFLHSQVHEAEENVKRAKRYYQLTQNEYSRGVKNSPDVVGASDRLLENQLMELSLLRDFQIARSHVLSKLGR